MGRHCYFFNFIHFCGSVIASGFISYRHLEIDPFHLAFLAFWNIKFEVIPLRSCEFVWRVMYQLLFFVLNFVMQCSFFDFHLPMNLSILLFKKTTVQFILYMVILVSVSLFSITVFIIYCYQLVLGYAHCSSRGLSLYHLFEIFCFVR